MPPNCGARLLVRARASDLAELGNPARIRSRAGIHRGARFKQHYFAGIIQSDGAMLDAMRHDDEFVRLHNLVAVAKLHEKAALVHKEEFVPLLVETPGKFAFEFSKFDLHIVDLARDLRCPGVGEALERTGQVPFVERRNTLVERSDVANNRGELTRNAFLLPRTFAVERGRADRKARSASLLDHADLLGRVDGAGDIVRLGHCGADGLDKRWNVFLGPVGQQVKAMRRERLGAFDYLLNGPFGRSCSETYHASKTADVRNFVGGIVRQARLMSPRYEYACTVTQIASGHVIVSIAGGDVHGLFG